MKNQINRLGFLLLVSFFAGYCTNAETPLGNSSGGTSSGGTSSNSAIVSGDGTQLNPYVTETPDAGTAVNLNGSLTAPDNHYYQVPVTAGVMYTVSLSGLSVDLDLYVYDNSSFSASICSPFKGGTSPETCIEAGPAGGFFYIEIRNYASADTNYTLSITSNNGPGVPTYTASPANNSSIFANQPVEVTFGETMDTTSLTMTGTLAASAITSWSTLAVSNDKLTITPSATWPLGTQTLTLTAANLNGSNVTVSLTYTVSAADVTAPTVVMRLIANGDTIAHTDTLSFRFSESVQTGSLALTGTLAASASVAWSTVFNPNDTITLTPTTTWPAGGNQTIDIAATDLSGNAMATPTSFYVHILDGIIYVRASDGLDTNPGTFDLPKLTVKRALSDLSYLFTGGEIHVAEGTYTVTYGDLGIGNHIIMREGFSLFGGYSAANWNTRDPVTYPTIIQDNSTSGPIFQHHPIQVPAGITNATVIDGLHLIGSNNSDTTAIYIDNSSPTITNNTLHGGQGGYRTYGIYITNGGNPVITDNTIYGSAPGFVSSNVTYGIYVGANSQAQIARNTIVGGAASFNAWGISSAGAVTVTDNLIRGGTANYVTGVYQGNVLSSYHRNTIYGGNSNGFSCIGINLINSSSEIFNNVIVGGSDLMVTYASCTGVNLEGTAGNVPLIYNNTINAGTSGNTMIGIRMDLAINADIRNNIIMTSGGINMICMKELVDGSDPANLLNNDFFGCPTLYMDSVVGGWTSITAVADLNNAALTTQGAAATSTGNLFVDPVIADFDGPDNDIQTWADNDWHLSIASPASVTQGGLDLSAFFSNDLDALARTLPWSLGAYEQ